MKYSWGSSALYLGSRVSQLVKNRERETSSKISNEQCASTNVEFTIDLACNNFKNPTFMDETRYSYSYFLTRQRASSGHSKFATIM